jgi:hypothetical protein
MEMKNKRPTYEELMKPFKCTCAQCLQKVIDNIKDEEKATTTG